MNKLKLQRCSHFNKNNEHGFTLIEIIIAIVIIGIAVPTIMIPFSGLDDTKNPEYVVQASFIAQQSMEAIADSNRTTALANCNSLTTPVNGYTLTCSAVAVNATNPDVTTGGATFAQKLTLTVGRSDGAMTPMAFNSLFAFD
jgi:prepilin-type N-terminal cleavage/methylation domain-containing protein